MHACSSLQKQAFQLCHKLDAKCFLVLTALLTVNFRWLVIVFNCQNPVWPDKYQINILFIYTLFLVCLLNKTNFFFFKKSEIGLI